MNEFDKIYGYEKEKNELMKLCDILRNKDKYTALGVCAPKAVLIYGEPGLGKTLMAKAFIAQSGRKVFQCKKNRPSDEFAEEITKTFERAVKEAPSIIFLDDMDKFAEDNLKQDCNKEEFSIIQTGFESLDNADVFVIATANDITYLPDSLLRDGRFGRKIMFSSPSRTDSVKIIEHYLSAKKISPDISAESLSYILSGKSCAMLESVINEAGICAAFENADEITPDHIKSAISSVLIERLPLNASKEKKTKIAYHEAGHAALCLLFHKKISCLAIGKCGKDGIGLGCCIVSENDSEIAADSPFEENRRYIVTLLGGKAASELRYGEIELGARRDIDRAVETLEFLLRESAAYGFEYCYTTNKFSQSQAYKHLDDIQQKIGELLNEYYAEAKTLLSENTDLLDCIATALAEKEILLYDEIEAIAEKFGLD